MYLNNKVALIVKQDRRLTLTLDVFKWSAYKWAFNDLID